MYVIGDVHGQFPKLNRLLSDAGLLGDAQRWTGGDAALLLVGDYFDRGPDGIGVVELVMRLQREAEAEGGAVHALLGNHDALILAAQRFGGKYWLDGWERNGGNHADLSRLRDEHVEWITEQPAMLRVGDVLYAHADATFYTRYGDTLEDVNAAFINLLEAGDESAWDQLLDDFSKRHAFDGPDGADSAARFLRQYGGDQLVHGHTPIPKVTGAPAEAVTRAHRYAAGRCVNVDGGMYLGGPGFVYKVPAPVHSR
jgi:hypothetical protein